MQGGIPSAGQMAIPRGMPMGAGIVDYLASAPEQRIWHVLRHEKTLASTDTGQIDFFDAVTSAPLDGNVERAGTIPEPQIFFVFGISMRIAAAVTLADLKLMLDSLYLEVYVNNRREFGPLNIAHFPAGGGPAGAAGGTLTIATNGMPSGQMMNWLPVPIVEKGGEIFRYQMHIEAVITGLSASTRIECAQHGILFRRAVSQ